MSSEGHVFAFQSGDAEEGPAIHFVQKLLAFLEVRVILSFLQANQYSLRHQDPSSGLEWNEAGDAICVRDADEFAKNTLPLHFKHSNFASFVRQLHMYGFSKSPPLPPPARPVHEFRHRHLLRQDLSLARFIRRRNSAGAIAGTVSISGASNELKLLSQQVSPLCAAPIAYFHQRFCFAGTRRDGAPGGYGACFDAAARSPSSREWHAVAADRNFTAESRCAEQQVEPSCLDLSTHREQALDFKSEQNCCAQHSAAH